MHREEDFAADDRPRDYSRYLNMSKEELDNEIARLEKEHEKSKQKELKTI